MILYRPTGRQERELVLASGSRLWPPRLPGQPIFYPVTTFVYAEKIARDWNSRQPPPDNTGFVTRFEITAETAARYQVQQAGGRDHEELWVLAGDLDQFNAGIVGLIEVIARYRDGHRID